MSVYHSHMSSFHMDDEGSQSLSQIRARHAIRLDSQPFFGGEDNVEDVPVCSKGEPSTPVQGMLAARDTNVIRQPTIKSLSKTSASPSFGEEHSRSAHAAGAFPVLNPPLLPVKAFTTNALNTGRADPSISRSREASLSSLLDLRSFSHYHVSEKPAEGMRVGESPRCVNDELLLNESTVMEVDPNVVVEASVGMIAPIQNTVNDVEDASTFNNEGSLIARRQKSSVPRSPVPRTDAASFFNSERLFSPNGKDPTPTIAHLGVLGEAAGVRANASLSMDFEAKHPKDPTSVSKDPPRPLCHPLSEPSRVSSSTPLRRRSFVLPRFPFPSERPLGEGYFPLETRLTPPAVEGDGSGKGARVEGSPVPSATPAGVITARVTTPASSISLELTPPTRHFSGVEAVRQFHSAVRRVAHALQPGQVIEAEKHAPLAMKGDNSRTPPHPTTSPFGGPPRRLAFPLPASQPEEADECPLSPFPRPVGGAEKACDSPPPRTTFRQAWTSGPSRASRGVVTQHTQPPPSLTRCTRGPLQRRSSRRWREGSIAPLLFKTVARRRVRLWCCRFPPMFHPRSPHLGYPTVEVMAITSITATAVLPLR
ncbi:unnamed protein product [Phytomonas sp. Hart1]|nr:unnamed protein product [Phytomonas sp. Hart1]|eukprot:CCW69709.1 unnamed protein product [Phytomonas sp. isolate Hart1]